MTQYRHGDLLIMPIAEMPKDAKETLKTKDRILAYGEVTGHAHRLSSGTVLELNGETFFSVSEKTELTHEEHGTIVFDPGNYRVIHQREYSPEYGSRAVAD